MNFKRIGRLLVCLLLVCALLVNVSPIKAEAVAVESALGIGLCALIILGSVGMIYTGLTQGQIQGVGNAFSTYMYQWGTSAEKLDEVDEFMGGLTLYNGSGDGDDDNDWDKRFHMTDATKAAVAMFAMEAIAADGVDVHDLGMNAPDGLMYYGENLFYEIPSRSDYENVIIRENGSTYELNFYNGSLEYDIYGRYLGTGPTYGLVSNGWQYAVNGLFIINDLSSVVWSNNDLTDHEGSVVCPGSEPSQNPALALKTETYVGDIPEGVKNGSLAVDDIQLPDTFDLSSIAAANPDLQTGVMDYLQQVANGTVTYEDYMATVVPEAVPEPEPEPDPEPSEETFPAIVPDAGEDTVGNTNVNTFLQEVTGIVTTPFKWIWENLDIKLDTLKPLEFDFDKLTSIVTEPAKWIWGNIESFFAPLFDSTWSYIQAIPDKIGETAADLGTKLQTIPDAIAQGAAQVKTAVEEAVEKAVMPEEDYLTDKVNALREEYAFADSIVRTGEALKNGLAGISTEPPVIYIHLGDTEGSYNIGGSVPFLDLRWYERYKPTVDILISAFLWICFVWRMLVKLPGIISGMPGDFVMTSAHNMGVTEYLPTRTKEYEIQRISNREMIRKGPDK